MKIWNTRVLLILTLAAASLRAQSGAVSQISGTVRDPGGLAVPEAQITITQTATGLTRAVMTGPDGEDTIAIRTCAYFFLSFDHKVVDGADADRFMGDLKRTLESIPDQGF